MNKERVTLQTSILLVNLGTPKSASYFSTMRFLREFLSDNRVVGISRYIWYPILYGFILPFRSYASSNKYKRIETEDGMPLEYITKALYKKVKAGIESGLADTKVYYAMRYGENSIAGVLEALKSIPHKELIILPLFPQYSATTTGSIFDEVARALQTWSFIPNYRFIGGYADDMNYIQGLSESIKEHWQKSKRSEMLLFTYHGLPEKNLINGDPYYCYCQKTTRLVAESLGLKDGTYQTVFQSRFGPNRWLQPYTESVIEDMAKRGIKEIDIIAPSFAVDCLETIDEITREYQEVFTHHGGKNLYYIDALNDTDRHAHIITKIISAAI